ncbi:MAG TPA: hypothetical protein VHO70_17520 [Chitinispirillaceae bacterium]|nr:hypothetical protein [Chitinispirillaceae bacterium]
MSSGIHNHHTDYHSRHSIRLPGYDYSKQGHYFMTVCIHDRKDHFFGVITNGKMELNDFGYIVQNEIVKTEQMRPNIKVDEYIIMPNHFHVIYQICNNDPRRGMLQRAPTIDITKI